VVGYSERKMVGVGFVTEAASTLSNAVIANTLEGLDGLAA
jgi:hypothetical protein